MFGELECGSLKDNDLQDSSLLPSVCWQRGEALYRQDKSLLEAGKVQLECVFQITLQKMINQCRNYSHVWLSQCAAACRDWRTEWCCGSALDTLGNVTETLGIVTTVTSCLPGSASQRCGSWVMVTGHHPLGPRHRMCQQLGSCSCLSWGPLQGPLFPAPQGQRTAQLRAAQPKVWMVWSVRGTEISPTLGGENSMHSPSQLPSARAGSNPAFLGFFLQSIE